MTALHQALQGLAAAAKASPDEVEQIRKALHGSYGERNGLLEQVSRRSRDPKLVSAVGKLKEQATAAAEGDDDDDDEIDWQEVAFIAILIFTL